MACSVRPVSPIDQSRCDLAYSCLDSVQISGLTVDQAGCQRKLKYLLAIFTESARLADSVSKLQCPSVVCQLRFETEFLHIGPHAKNLPIYRQTLRLLDQISPVG